MGSDYEEISVRLNELFEGDVFVGKWSPKEIKYLKNLGKDKHLLEDVKTGQVWQVPHGRFPSFRKITPNNTYQLKNSFEKSKSDWSSYSKHLSLSKEIYLNMFGEPKTHIEWADSFNKIGEINRIIINHKK